MKRSSEKRPSSQERASPTGNPVNETRVRSTKGTFIVCPDDNKSKGGNRDKIDHVPLRDNTELSSCIGCLWGQEERDETFSLLRLGPYDIGESLNRDQKRALLKELANTTKYPKEKMSLELFEGKTYDGSKHKGFHLKVKLSYAAILTINLALRDERMDTCNVFAELIGCATPETVVELSPFLRYPLISLKELPTLIHCAVRNIARSGKENRSKEPVKLAIRTARAVATALEYSIELNPDRLKAEKKSWLGKYKRDKDNKTAVPTRKPLDDLLVNTLKKAEWKEDHNGTSPDMNEAAKEKEENRLYRYSRDLGCHSGLLLAGIQTYLMRSQEEEEEMEIKCTLLIDVVSGLLSGVPQAGFLFGPVGSLVKLLKHEDLKKNQENREKVSRNIKEYFDETVWAPIFFDDEFFLKDREGNDLIGTERVKWDVFSQWYEQIIRWNQVYINWH